MLPLAACLALALAGATATAADPARRSLARSVDSCADDGPGSLRAAVAAAASGDTIDLSTLTCGTLTLATGAIVVAQDELTIAGPGAAALTLDAALADRVFRHTGTGTLHLRGLGLARGRTDSSGGCLASTGNLELDRVDVADCAARDLADGALVRGGGVHANGDVVLRDSRVHECSAYSSNSSALGGGIYARGTLDLQHSTVSGNDATSMAPTGTLIPGGAAYAGAFGGGVASYRALTLVASTIAANDALAPNNHGGDQANGGGVFVAYGSATVRDSTIDHNHADHLGGGAAFIHFGSSLTRIENSTISGNHAGGDAAGVFTQPSLNLTGSTIAFNHTDGPRAGGVLVGFDHTGRIDSSILAGNTAGSGPSDLGQDSRSMLWGAHNLIGVGGDTLTGTLHADPRLGPLQDNGGPTRTHALHSGSPAIDAGSNPAALVYDQRGEPHPRLLGAAVDIGAFEFDAAETIFSDGFD